MKHNYSDKGKNYRIRIRDKHPEITDEQIAQHMDFESVLKGYRGYTQRVYRRPLYRNPKAFLGLVLIAVMGYLVFNAVQEERNNVADGAVAMGGPGDEGAGGKGPGDGAGGGAYGAGATTAFLGFDLEGEMPADEALAFDPTSEQKLASADGIATVSFPANTFRGEGGATLMSGGTDEGSTPRVELLALCKPGDLIAAKLPALHSREIDGQTMRMTGAIHVQAFQGHAPLSLDIAKRVTVEFEACGPNKPEVYWLNESTGEWEMTGYPLEVIAPAPPQNDGFNVVEMGGEQVTVDKGEATPTRYRFHAERMGWFSFVSKPEGDMQTSMVRFSNGDNTGRHLPLRSLYFVAEGQEGLLYAWPRDKSHLFKLQIPKGVKGSLYGVNLDGNWWKADEEAVRMLKFDGSEEEIKMEIVREDLRTVEDLHRTFGGS